MKQQPKKNPPKPRFTNPVVNENFLKEWWRQKIVAANKGK